MILNNKMLKITQTLPEYLNYRIWNLIIMKIEIFKMLSNLVLLIKNRKKQYGVGLKYLKIRIKKTIRKL